MFFPPFICSVQMRYQERLSIDYQPNKYVIFFLLRASYLMVIHTCMPGSTNNQSQKAYERKCMLKLSCDRLKNELQIEYIKNSTIVESK